MAKIETCDALVIGGGIYGCLCATTLSRYFGQVTIVESEEALCTRSSRQNQARVHQGYHYPRSMQTAKSSKNNFLKFSSDFGDCIRSDFSKFYAIASSNSKISAQQFRKFCKRIQAPCEQAPKNIRDKFNSKLIEDVFLVQEYAFDIDILTELLRQKINKYQIDLRLKTKAKKITQHKNKLIVHTVHEGQESVFSPKFVLNCSYANINTLLQNSNLTKLPLKQELAEIALLRPLSHTMDISITVMDGPFFSMMPYPSKNLTSVSHVQYTPHLHWHEDTKTPVTELNSAQLANVTSSNYPKMRRDIERYYPGINDYDYIESLWELKTIIPKSEFNDSRPILLAESGNYSNLFSILGGKIDNIYDIQHELATRVTKHKDINN